MRIKLRSLLGYGYTNTLIAYDVSNMITLGTRVPH